MPITPLHFGPALSTRIVFPRLSLGIFATTQFLMDCETAVNFFAGQIRLHGFFHSFLGSLIPFAIAYLLHRPLFHWLAPKLARFPTFQKWAKAEGHLSRYVVLGTGLFAVWSHVVLDAIMHSDLTPFYPFSESNPFLQVVPASGLNQFCLIALLVGLAVAWTRRERSEPKHNP